MELLVPSPSANFVDRCGNAAFPVANGSESSIDVRESTDEQAFASPPITEQFLEDLKRVLR